MLRSNRNRLPHQRERGALSPRASKIMVIAGVIIILLVSLLSALILIEGARNPATLPEPERQQEVAPGPEPQRELAPEP